MVLYVTNDDFFRNHGVTASSIFFIFKFFKLKLNLPNATPEFVGLQNYIKMLTDETVRTSTLNTLFFAIISVALEVIVGLFGCNGTVLR